MFDKSLMKKLKHKEKMQIDERKKKTKNIRPEQSTVKYVSREEPFTDPQSFN